MRPVRTPGWAVCEAIERRVRAVLTGLADVSGSSPEARQSNPRQKKANGDKSVAHAQSEETARLTPSSS
jgi:hypothetical protein